MDDMLNPRRGKRLIERDDILSPMSYNNFKGRFSSNPVQEKGDIKIGWSRNDQTKALNGGCSMTKSNNKMIRCAVCGRKATRLHKRIGAAQLIRDYLCEAHYKTHQEQLAWDKMTIESETTPRSGVPE